MLIIKVIGTLLVLTVGAYIVNGGWAENLGALYRNYKQSNMSLAEFWRGIIRKRK
ncbi:hypothetical protein KAR50_05825 [Periweissella fabaria]|uniref:Uncharacterized protein n=1 Tax=Periweissella fabaria TaxID=546157 RepID=A0ABN8BEE1_9LACO|nr:hypothetical protein [Periweissella fabaria]MCM0597358.1 hypothetical protein [Periweissella fabaria]CAH0416136.1 hypothetical protein WFA24289_00435 [Periweissella fabaria]